MKKVVNLVLVALIIGFGGIVLSACDKNDKVTPLVEIQTFETSTITMDIGVLPEIQLVSAEYEGENVEGNIAWDNNILKLGENSYSWTFTPTNNKKYNRVKGEVVFTGVKKVLTPGVDFEVEYNEYVAIDEGLGEITLKDEYAHLGTVKWETPDLELTTLGENAVAYIFIPFDTEKYEMTSNHIVIVNVGDFRGGTGISSDPYLVGTAEQFLKIAGDTVDYSTGEEITTTNLDKYYRIVDDIDFSSYNFVEKIDDNLGEYKYISSDKTYLSLIKGTFTGNINGNGKTIYLGNIESTDENFIFYIFENVLGASISSLNIQANGPVSLVRNAGDISNISNVDNKEYVTTFDGITLTGSTDFANMNYTPFIYKAGYNNNSVNTSTKVVLNNCINYYSINAETNIGAFVGYVYSTLEYNWCSNYADITGNTVGVLIATKENIDEFITVNSCYNYGNVISASNVDESGLVTYDETEITSQEILTGIVNSENGIYQGSVSKKEQ